MAIYKLGDVAIEAKSSQKGDKIGCKIVGLEHLTPSNITLSAWSEDLNNTFTKEFLKGDVLFGRRRAYLKKAAVAPFDGICSGDITVIRAKEGKVNPQLLPFIIQNDYFFEYAVGKSAGSLSPRVKWEHLKNFEITLPDMDGQKQLADTLWSINEAKQAYLELIKQTDELVKSQFIEMFGLPESNIHRYEVGTIADVVKDVHYGTSRKASEDGKYIYIRMNNITYEGELDLTDIKRINVPDNELAGCEVKAGDVLFNRTNSRELVGKTCTFAETESMIIAGYIIRLRMNGRVKADYLSTYLNLKRSKNMLLAMAKGAVGQANINAQEVQSIPIIIPPEEVQDAFINLKEQSDKSKFELQDAIHNLDALSKKIIAENLIAARKE